jgi:glycosyltransferase involved in cell wall biosynthesis
VSDKKGDTIMNAKGKPEVSIIIPTKNSQRVLRDCLNSVFRQSYGNFEVILVDNYSTDDTIKIASDFPVKILYEDKGTRAAACNLGIASASGQIVAFTDADCIVPEDWVERIAKHFENADVCIVGGPDLTPNDSSMWERAFGAVQTYIMKFERKFGPVEEIIGCNSSYRKEAVLKVGGFREDLITTEETELHRRIDRMNCKLLYDPHLTVLHYRRTNLRKFFRQQFRYGLGKGMMLRSDPSAFKISDVIALLSVFIPLALIPTYLLLPDIVQFFFGFLLSLFLIAVATLALYCSIKERKASLALFVYLPIIIHIAAQGLGHVAGLLKLQRSRRSDRLKCSSSLPAGEKVKTRMDRSLISINFTFRSDLYIILFHKNKH